MDKSIPLSELIRIGSKVTKKCCLTFYRKGDDDSLATCAIGAAYYAKFAKLPEGLSMKTTMEYLGVDADAKVNIDVPDCPNTLRNAITFLNDYTLWSRENIADWLESIGL